MIQNKIFKALSLVIGLQGATSAFATTTYTFNDPNSFTINALGPTANLFSGSFSANTDLTDGIYNFFQGNLINTFTLNPYTFNNYHGSTTGSGLPTITGSTGFIDQVLNANTTVYANQVSSTSVVPSDPVFSLTISNGKVSAWDISYTTSSNYSSGSGSHTVGHAGDIQLTTTNTGDSTVNLITNNVVYKYSSLNTTVGTWSITSETVPATTAVPEPEMISMFALGLISLVITARKKA
jgi:hypothetical protein